MRKHKLVKPLKTLAIIRKLFNFISISIYTCTAHILLNESKSSIEPQLKTIWICYYAIVLKQEKKKQKFNTHITFSKMHIGQQTKHQLRHNISKHVNF